MPLKRKEEKGGLFLDWGKGETFLRKKGGTRVGGGSVSVAFWLFQHPPLQKPEWDKC